MVFFTTSITLIFACLNYGYISFAVYLKYQGMVDNYFMRQQVIKAAELTTPEKAEH